QVETHMGAMSLTRPQTSRGSPFIGLGVQVKRLVWNPQSRSCDEGRARPDDTCDCSFRSSGYAEACAAVETRATSTSLSAVRLFAAAARRALSETPAARDNTGPRTQRGTDPAAARRQPWCLGLLIAQYAQRIESRCTEPRNPTGDEGNREHEHGHCRY